MHLREYFLDGFYVLDTFLYFPIYLTEKHYSRILAITIKYLAESDKETHIDILLRVSYKLLNIRKCVSQWKNLIHQTNLSFQAIDYKYCWDVVLRNRVWYNYVNIDQFMSKFVNPIRKRVSESIQLRSRHWIHFHVDACILNVPISSSSPSLFCAFYLMVIVVVEFQMSREDWDNVRSHDSHLHYFIRVMADHHLKLRDVVNIFGDSEHAPVNHNLHNSPLFNVTPSVKKSAILHEFIDSVLQDCPAACQQFAQCRGIWYVRRF